MGTMSEKVVVITGANTGIGKAAAEALAREGAEVLITARNREKGEAARADIQKTAGHDRVHLFLADFARLCDVRRLASELDEATDKIDVLINNAGVVLSERSTTEDGYETTFQVNHLAPYLLTTRLLEKLKCSGGRIINTSSAVHDAGGPLDWDDLMNEKAYKGFRVYGQSKLCNILFTRALARRLEGTEATTNALHPGVVDTEFAANGDTKGLFSLFLGLFRPFYRSPEKGAATTIYLASSPDVEGVSGQYFVDKKPKEPKRVARDEEAAERLWEVSEALCQRVAGA